MYSSSVCSIVRPPVRHTHKRMLSQAAKRKWLSNCSWRCASKQLYYQQFCPNQSMYVYPQNLLPDLEGKRLGRLRWNFAGMTILGSSSALQKIGPTLHCLTTVEPSPPKKILNTPASDPSSVWISVYNIFDGMHVHIENWPNENQKNCSELFFTQNG